MTQALQAQSDASIQIKKSTEEAKSRLDEEISAIREEATNEAKTKLKEVDDALTLVRNAASEAGVSQHAKVFDDESKKLQTSSIIWMIVIAIFALLLGLLATNFIDPKSWHPVLPSISASTAATIAASATPTVGNAIPAPAVTPPATDFLWIKPFAEKIAFAFVLLFGLLWSSRNYSASRHNEVVNRHRMNALRSFETFAKAATDDQTKNAVLIQATQAIFAPQATGYVKTDGDNSSSSPIIELIRTASPSGK